MKNNFISVCLLLLWLTTGFVQAQRVAETTVRAVATNFINRMYTDKSRTIKSVYREGKNPMQPTFSDATTNINVVSFNQGGWVIVSNDESAPPVLAFSEFGTFTTDTNDMPPGLIELMQEYRDMVAAVRSDVATKGSADYTDNQNSWSKLKSGQTKGVPATIYVDDLLKDPARGGKVHWGQEASYCLGDFERAYNRYMPSPSTSWWSGECTFSGVSPAGCGTVAMAQIMWYWKFPPQYDWDEMPSSVNCGTPVYQAHNIAGLYKKCGDVNGMTYLSCRGSFTTVNDVVIGMKSFGYSNAEKVTKKDRDDRQWWPNLIRYNLDRGRPIIYRGDECDLCASKHIWNISGYGSDGYFYCNWGWRSSCDGWFTIKGLRPGGDDFRKNNMIIQEIYPNWNVTNDAVFANITKGNNEEIRAFNRNITLRNVKLSGNAKAKLCFTETLTIEGELSVGLGTSFVLQSYGNEATAAQAMRANANRDDEDMFDMDAEMSDQTDVSVWATLPPEIEEDNRDIPNNVWGLWPNPNQGSFEVVVSQPHVQNQAKTILVYSPDGSLVYETDFDGERCHIQGITSKGLHLVLLKISERVYPLKMVIK